MPKLSRLSLVGNPVTRAKDYRLYVIALLPKLKLLDFNKVKAAERLAAIQQFGLLAKNGPTAASGASAAAAAESQGKTFTPGGEVTADIVHRITPELREAIKVC